MARLEQILLRQHPPAFGQTYQPSIKATREEAPAGSRPANVWSQLLQRDVATLSRPEQLLLPLILYCPRLFDLQEQRMLPYLSAPHPLNGHPLAVGTSLPAFRGTLAVAEQLGELRFHPTISHRNEQGTTDVVPGCWIGDFLLFLVDAVGPYCVNLTVKSTKSEFDTPQLGITPRTNLSRAARREWVRHKTEAVLFHEVGIPTHQVAGDSLDLAVVHNLSQLMLWQKRHHKFDKEKQALILASFHDGLDAGSCALEVMNALELSEGFSRYDIKIVMYQAIWERKLRINLFELFCTDRPMEPETRDVLDVYGSWFARSVP